MGNLFKRTKKSKPSTLKRLESFRFSKKVCAIFDYISVNPEELSFERNDILYANVKSNRLWWFAKHEKNKKTGYIPRNYVVEYDDCNTFLPAWHNINHVETNCKLMKSDQPLGTFIIRPCSNRQNLVLSIKCEEEAIVIKNYRIMVNVNEYWIFPNQKFSHLVQLIQYYSKFSDGLICKLGQPYSNQERPTVQFRHIEVNRLDFDFVKQIGQGHFSEVFLARHKINKNLVAVKILRQCHEDRKTFLKEAKLMHQLYHERIVRLLGICTRPRTESMFIITEFMENGSLLHYLKKSEGRNIKFRDMIIMLMEITEGMSYLELKSYIHRDLRAANILVGKDRSVKVADFGLARMVEDLYITSEENYEFPVRWMAKEVLLDNKFTLKSDVWSFGILMFEIITFGQDPYPEFNNRQVVDKVKSGYIMSKPTGSKVRCSDRYYDIMKNCWTLHRERPSFGNLFEEFKEWANSQSEFSLV